MLTSGCSGAASEATIEPGHIAFFHIMCCCAQVTDFGLSRPRHLPLLPDSDHLTLSRVLPWTAPGKTDWLQAQTCLCVWRGRGEEGMTWGRTGPSEGWHSPTRAVCKGPLPHVGVAGSTVCRVVGGGS